MGAVNSKAGESGPLFLRDQTRFSVAALQVTNSRNRTLLNITPNAFPATRYTAKRELGDDSVIEYIQDPESNTASDGTPTFLIRLPSDEELTFNFTFILRQHLAVPSIYNANNASAVPASGLVDTVINGLTFVFASSTKELDNLVTREFHANPNLHKNPQVELVGDYTTGGSSSVQFHWSWKWTPPKTAESRGGGWRTSCSFVEYDQRAHKLESLANFAFWVQNTARSLNSPRSPTPKMELSVPPRLRVPSAQSIESRVSDSAEENKDFDNVPPKSPICEAIPESGLNLVPSHATTLTSNSAPLKLDVSRPGEDLSQTEDGPLFRATMKSLEQKTGNMRTRWKKVLKRAESAMEAQVSCNNAMSDLIDALKEASTSNANAVQPAIDNYFDKIAKEILAYERTNTTNIQKSIIDPIHKLYNIDIKQAETKRKDFEEESKDYYQYLGRYLGTRTDSLKEKKKKAETDSKYQAKRRNFELKRFDYSSFMQDLHGGRKDQDILSHLTRYADCQAKYYLDTAKRIETMLPQLEALSQEVKEADKEFQIQRTEREEKRRALEKTKKTFDEPQPQQIITATMSNGSVPKTANKSDAELPGRKPSIVPVFQSSVSPPPTMSSTSVPSVTSPQSPEMSKTSLSQITPQADKFKGIRDLEEKDPAAVADGTMGAHRKEGLLWALSRPGSHVDPKGLNKQAWHKFWVVLDQGKLSEYTNWKQSLELHMDPIDLRMASVREARNADRRFCFEVITPQYTRVYQATNEDDLKSWISAVNNALQTAVETAPKSDRPSTDSLPGQTRRDIASVLTGKSPSLSSHRNNYSSKAPARHATVGDKPGYRREESTGEDGKLLKQVREADPSNKVCADCGSEIKVDWVSINLGIVICIECSGIHRSLGTHITKVRSLTLDVTSFTPDIVEILLKIGNRVSNSIWEARLDPSLKPGPMSTREQRLHFITSKYADRAYVAPISPTSSHYLTPEETLLASVKKNDITNVLYALALKANPNSRDRSRGTHVVFLALAAADPASPSAAASPATSPLPTSTSTARPSTPQPNRKPFSVAELLLQNGAELPSQPAPIPLGSSARSYLDFKADQRAGKRVGTQGAVGPGTHTTMADTLPQLPSILAGNGSTPAERAREREQRLQKRVSAGGRLVKTPGGFEDAKRGLS